MVINIGREKRKGKYCKWTKKLEEKETFNNFSLLLPVSSKRLKDFKYFCAAEYFYFTFNILSLLDTRPHGFVHVSHFPGIMDEMMFKLTRVASGSRAHTLWMEKTSK